MKGHSGKTPSRLRGDCEKLKEVIFALCKVCLNDEERGDYKKIEGGNLSFL